MGRLGKIAVPLVGVLVLLGPARAAAEQAAPPPPHIQAVLEFLLGWGRGNWEAMQGHAGERVMVRVQGTDYVLDLAGRTAEVRLVFPFRGLATVRVGGSVKGVTVERIVVRTESGETEGSGTVTLEENDGVFIVTSIAVE